MSIKALVVASVVVVAGVSLSMAGARGEPPASGSPAPGSGAPESPAAGDAQVLAFTVKDIDGKDVDLAQYKGKVVLIVNVASKCGYTPQYKGLQKLFEEKKESGLVILGFPANEFGGQEPGSDAEIKQFCHDKYSVTFPMFGKISVKGANQHPLYKKLSAQPAPIGGEPRWNFTKFLVDRSGNVVARYDSKVAPEDKALRAKIEELLGAK